MVQWDKSDGFRQLSILCAGLYEWSIQCVGDVTRLFLCRVYLKQQGSLCWWWLSLEMGHYIFGCGRGHNRSTPCRLNGFTCQAVYAYSLQRKTICFLMQVLQNGKNGESSRNLSQLIRKRLSSPWSVHMLCLSGNSAVFILRTYQFPLSHRRSHDGSCYQGVCPSSVKSLLSRGCVISMIAANTVIIVDFQDDEGCSWE